MCTGFKLKKTLVGSGILSRLEDFLANIYLNSCGRLSIRIGERTLLRREMKTVMEIFNGIVHLLSFNVTKNGKLQITVRSVLLHTR